MNYLQEALQDPQTLVKAAWFILNGDDAFNSIEDRALSEHRGSALLMKKASGKYSILLPITSTGENGSTPAQLDKTAIGNPQATSVEGSTKNNSFLLT